MSGRTVLALCLAVLPAIWWSGAAGAVETNLGTPTAGNAAPDLTEVRAALRQDAVYIESGYELLSASEANQISALVRESATPIYLVAVRNETADAAGGLTALLRQVVAEMDSRGTYVVADERAFRTTSSSMRVADLADQANASASGAFNVLKGYVSLVQKRADSPARGQLAGVTESAEEANQGFPLVPVLVIVMAVAGVWLVARSRRPVSPRPNSDVARLRQLLTADITAIGEQLGQVDAQNPGLGEVGREHLSAALDAYDRARAASDRLRTVTDAQQVTSALDDARHELACAQALAAGQPPPDRRPPCLFDARHGTSLRDVMWTPPPVGFAAQHPREVPACAECARTVDLGGAPQVRMVGGQHGGMVPYWEGGAAYAPYARGYYDAYGTNLLGALLVGTMFAQWHAAGSDPADQVAGEDPGGGFDLGGGDWGSSDFGGGDFGGGF